MTQWQDAELPRNREAREHFKAATWGPLNVQFEQLGDQVHYRAVVEREKLRPKLAQAELELEVMDRDLAFRERREQLVNAVLPAYVRERASLEAIVEDIKARCRVDAIPNMLETFRDLDTRARALTSLRRVLHDATGDPRFAKAWDPIDDVRYFWHQEAQRRARVFTHVLGPGYPRKKEPSPWADDAAQLSALLAEADKVLV
jgi:hypothetical protein